MRGCFGGKPMAKNCKVKLCNESHGYDTCAQCEEFKDLKGCKKLNNMLSKFFGFIFRTDRKENLEHIRKIGMENFKKKNM